MEHHWNKSMQTQSRKDVTNKTCTSIQIQFKITKYRTFNIKEIKWEHLEKEDENTKTTLEYMRKKGKKPLTQYK